jgi:hypothetical protein
VTRRKSCRANGLWACALTNAWEVSAVSRSTPGGPYRVYTTAFMGWLPPATAHCRLRPTAPGPATSMRQGGPGSGASSGTTTVPAQITPSGYAVRVAATSPDHRADRPGLPGLQRSQLSPAHRAEQAGICAGARRLRLLSVTGFPVSPRPRLAEVRAAGHRPEICCPAHVVHAFGLAAPAGFDEQVIAWPTRPVRSASCPATPKEEHSAIHASPAGLRSTRQAYHRSAPFARARSEMPDMICPGVTPGARRAASRGGAQPAHLPRPPRTYRRHPHHKLVPARLGPLPAGCST